MLLIEYSIILYSATGFGKKKKILCKAVEGKSSDKWFCICFTMLLKYYKEELYATVFVNVTTQLWIFHWLH